MSRIKTRESVRNIKVLDQSAIVGQRMKNAFIRTKEKAAGLSEDRQGTPNEFAEDTLLYAAEDIAVDITSLAGHRAKKAAQKRREEFPHRRTETVQAKRGEVDRRISFEETYIGSRSAQFCEGAPRQIPYDNSSIPKQPDSVERGRELAIKQSEKRLETVRYRRDRALRENTPAGSESSGIKVKESVLRINEPLVVDKRQGVRLDHRGSLSPARSAVKGSERSIKTAQSIPQSSVKMAQSYARITQQAEKTVLTMKRTAMQSARAVTKKTALTAKTAVRAVVLAGKAAAAGLSGMISVLMSGGWIAMLVVVVICLIGLLAGSGFGVFFATEDYGTGLTIQTAMSQINAEFSERVEEIKSRYDGQYSSVEASNNGVVSNWQDVLAVYAVKTTTDEKNPMEVATMTEEKMDILREIFWDMNDLSASLESSVLVITVTSKDCWQAAEEYDFDAEQKELLRELMESNLFNGLPHEMPGEYPILPGTGGYIWPLPGFHRISSPFGYRICPYHGRELHGGIDLPATGGSPILAAKSGTVITSRYGSSYGNYVVLSHPDGSRTLYAHMSSRAVAVGDTVEQGALIGRVGSTGNSTGNHLHFEVWVNSSSSSKVNPTAYF